MTDNIFTNDARTAICSQTRQDVAQCFADLEICLVLYGVWYYQWTFKNIRIERKS